MKKAIIEEWERDWFGAIIKWVFSSFNAVMALWFVLWVTNLFYMLFCIGWFDDAHMVGEVIEAFEGFPMLVFIWLVGDCSFVLMLLAIRSKKITRKISS